MVLLGLLGGLAAYAWLDQHGTWDRYFACAAVGWSALWALVALRRALRAWRIYARLRQRTSEGSVFEPGERWVEGSTFRPAPGAVWLACATGQSVRVELAEDALPVGAHVWLFGRLERALDNAVPDLLRERGYRDNAADEIWVLHGTPTLRIERRSPQRTRRAQLVSALGWSLAFASVGAYAARVSALAQHLGSNLGRSMRVLADDGSDYMVGPVDMVGPASLAMLVALLLSYRFSHPSRRAAHSHA